MLEADDALHINPRATCLQSNMLWDYEHYRSGQKMIVIYLVVPKSEVFLSMCQIHLVDLDAAISWLVHQYKCK